jgi:SMC interacting uncharacterized protein involved in chromosome segregation
MYDNLDKVTQDFMRHYNNKDLSGVQFSAQEHKSLLEQKLKRIQDDINELNQILYVVNAHHEIGLDLSDEEITEIRERLGDVIIGVKHPKRLDSKLPCKK